MKFRMPLVVLCLIGSCLPTLAQKGAPPSSAASANLVSSHIPYTPPPRPVARVNGAVLTDHDLLREMYAIFPYARQHNGAFPKAMEADIRRGALKMIEFEELVYQEAQRRHMSIAPERLAAGTFPPTKAHGGTPLRTDFPPFRSIPSPRTARIFMPERRAAFMFLLLPASTGVRRIPA